MASEKAISTARASVVAWSLRWPWPTALHWWQRRDYPHGVSHVHPYVTTKAEPSAFLCGRTVTAEMRYHQADADAKCCKRCLVASAVLGLKVEK